jgi:hypothetical protein
VSQPSHNQFGLGACLPDAPCAYHAHAPYGWRDPDGDCPFLQCQLRHDFATQAMKWKRASRRALIRADGPSRKLIPWSKVPPLGIRAEFASEGIAATGE